jgi:hypothetical protein
VFYSTETIKRNEMVKVLEQQLRDLQAAEDAAKHDLELVTRQLEREEELLLQAERDYAKAARTLLAIRELLDDDDRRDIGVDTFEDDIELRHRIRSHVSSDHMSPETRSSSVDTKTHCTATVPAHTSPISIQRVSIDACTRRSSLPSSRRVSFATGDRVHVLADEQAHNSTNSSHTSSDDSVLELIATMHTTESEAHTNAPGARVQHRESIGHFQPDAFALPPAKCTRSSSIASSDSGDGVTAFRQPAHTSMRRHFLEENKSFHVSPCNKCNKDICRRSKHMRCTQCKACFHQACSKDIAPTCTPMAPTSRGYKPPPAGTHLEACVCEQSRSGLLPLLVERCIDEVEKRGVHMHGIYRECGNTVNIIDLKKRFFSGGSSPSLSRVEDVREVAGCLKLFMRELDAPLLTFELYDAFIKSGRHSKAGDYTLMALAVGRLPWTNFHVLLALVRHLQT